MTAKKKYGCPDCQAPLTKHESGMLSSEDNREWSVVPDFYHCEACDESWFGYEIEEDEWIRA